jgi:hypothetical protein
VAWDTCIMLNNALCSFHDVDNFDAADGKCDGRPAAIQTWANLKITMRMEYAKTHRDGISAKTTGHASAHNVTNEYTAATEELN